MHIAIHLEAPHKPKAIKAAARLKMQPLEFILQVMAPVWIFAAMNNDGSGDVTGLDDDVLSSITFGRCNNLQVLIETGWLRFEDGVLQVPRWLEHEPYFGERARDRQRKRTERRAKDGKSQGSPTESHGLPALEEKRVEEKKLLHVAGQENDLNPVPNFRATFLAAYPECPNKRYSTEAENYWAMLTDAQRAKCMDSVNAYATAVLAAPKPERKWAVKPETWLTGFGPEFDSEACKTFDRGPPASDNVSESFKRPAGYFKPRM